MQAAAELLIKVYRQATAKSQQRQNSKSKDSKVYPAPQKMSRGLMRLSSVVRFKSFNELSPDFASRQLTQMMNNNEVVPTVWITTG